jgi:hypothetical protein
MNKYVLTNVTKMTVVALTNEEMDFIYDSLEEIKSLAWQHEEMANIIQGKLYGLEAVQ